MLAGHPPEENRAFLSGILVGSELAYLKGNALAAVPIVLCAAAPLDAIYRTALDALGLSGQLHVVSADDVDRLSTLGQAALVRILARDHRLDG